MYTSPTGLNNVIRYVDIAIERIGSGGMVKNIRVRNQLWNSQDGYYTP